MKTADEIMGLVTQYGATCVGYADGFETGSDLDRSRAALRIAIEALVVDAEKAHQRMPQGMAMQTEIDDLRGENEALLKANIYCTDNFNAMFCELETVKKHNDELLAKNEQLEDKNLEAVKMLAELESRRTIGGWLLEGTWDFHPGVEKPDEQGVFEPLYFGSKP